MNRIILSAAAATMTMGIAAPASACMTVDKQVTIHPVSQIKPSLKKNSMWSVFKIRYSGERAGRTDRLSNNFYVVGVLSGKMKGEKVAIPAHVTSCHSVYIEDGAEGYVVGTLKTKDRDGNRLEMPVLSTMMNGRKEKFSFKNLSPAPQQ